MPNCFNISAENSSCVVISRGLPFRSCECNSRLCSESNQSGCGPFEKFYCRDTGSIFTMLLIRISIIWVIVWIIWGIFFTIPFIKLTTICQAGINLVINLMQGIISKLPEIFSSGVKIIKSFIQGIVQMLPEVLNTAIQTVTDLKPICWKNSIYNCKRNM